jgi:hypothetical protein
MKKFLSLALVGALVLGVSSVVYANICAFDPAPAATLLFPFVAFDYNNPLQGTTTLFAITNVSSEAQIVHVTIWSDDSTAVLDFNIVLSGYDLQSINIRDILVDGQLPITGTFVPDDTVGTDGPEPVADGPVSHADGSWLDGILPYDPATNGTDWLVDRCLGDANPINYTQQIPNNQLDILELFFTATQVADKWHADCGGAEYNIGDWFEARDLSGPTWMYITADVVYECNRLFPYQASYWNEPQYQNVLIGDVFWLDDFANFSEADNAVHLEADPEIAQVATLDAAGDPVTFYHRYTAVAPNELGAIDFREPLPTAWAFRYLGVGSNAIDTHIRAWKGSTLFANIIDLVEDPGGYIAEDCLAYTYYAWDEDENVTTVDENPWSIPGVQAIYPNLLPLETQEVLVDEFNTVDNNGNGWMLFVWPNSNFDNIPGAVPTVPFDWYQTWMGVKYSAFQKFSAFVSGAVMANFNCFSDQVLPNLGVDYDYVNAVEGYHESPAYTGP